MAKQYSSEAMAAGRVERLLENNDPGSADHALVRFAAESVVAMDSGRTLEEHEALMAARFG